MSLDIVILEGPQTGLHIPLSPETVSFGRSPNATASFPQDNFMSGMHLEAHLAPGGVMLVDRRSTNGSFLNGRRITEAVAVPGDMIKIGSITMQIVDPEASSGETTPLQIGLTATMPMAVEALPPPKPEPLLSVLQKGDDPLYCLLDAAANDMIPSLMLLAKDRHERLDDFGASGSQSFSAPYLIELSPESALLGILTEKGWGNGWASYLHSTATFDAIAAHFRNVLALRGEELGEASFRFYDPRVLRDFLFAADKVELETMFKTISEWLLEAESKNVLLEMSKGGGGVHTIHVPLSDQG